MYFYIIKIQAFYIFLRSSVNPFVQPPEKGQLVHSKRFKNSCSIEQFNQTSSLKKINFNSLSARKV